MIKEIIMPRKVVRKPLIAAFMSLILPGYGQLYNGELNKGMMLFMLFTVCSVPLLAFAALYVPAEMMLIIVLLSVVLTLSLWLYGIKDAYQCAQQKSSMQRKAWQIPSVYIASFITAMFFILPSVNNTIQQYYVEPFYITSGSMSPSILEGDLLFADKRYNCPQCTQEVKRGDIAIFIHPNHRTRYYIKRVIALPKDKVKIVGHQVFINGQMLTETASIEPEIGSDDVSRHIITEKLENTIYQVYWTLTDDDDSTVSEFVVPQGKVFMLGDHRNASEDSRDFGAVPLRNVIAKARQVWFSWDKKEGVRWQRLGKVLY